MPAAETVVADTSPLLNLALIDRLDVLTQRWETITVPTAVWRELSAGEDGLDSLRSLRERDHIEVTDAARSDLYVELRHELDRGEAAAIELAIDADADVVLLDEREARTVARRHDLEITGAIGVLLWGAHQGSIEMESALDELRSAGFWIADDLYERVLERAPSATEE